MIVACSACDTRFEIQDEKYRPGRKARCSNCGNVFVLPELDAGAAAVDVPLSPAAAPAPAFASEPRIELEPQSAPESRIEPEPQNTPKPSDAAQTVPDAAPEVHAIPDPSDVVLPAGKKKAPSLKKRKVLAALILLAMICLLGYGGSVVYGVFFVTPAKTEAPVQQGDDRQARSPDNTATDSEKEAARLAVVSRLDIENVRQYMVTENEKIGPMIVIEGAVVNRFDTPKDLILLEITLYDDKGKALAAREQYCGATLSILQLRTLSKAAIESALTNQVAILSNNTNVLSGGRVPFTTVFFDLPRGAYEYEVKVVDAQDPAVRK